MRFCMVLGFFYVTEEVAIRRVRNAIAHANTSMHHAASL